MSGFSDRKAPTDDTWLAERFDDFVEGLLDGESADLQAAIAEHPELEDRIRESWELALQVSGRRPAPTLSFEGYAILRELGHGGMGTVYLARNETLGREVALKVLPPSLGLSARAKTRFLNEARALARVEDEHIVRIYDVVERQELLAYEMEWVDGKSLRQLIDALKPMGRDASLRHMAATLGAEEPELQTKSLISYLVQLGVSIARALAKVHAAGLVHRDVKPSNILVRRDGTPLLADFGLARGTDSSLTQSGAFAGTAVYAAPEQLRGDSESVDGRADVYALGVTLYEALAHRMPFQGRNTTEVLSRIERGDVTRLRKVTPAIPKDLETVVHKAMEPDPDRRYTSAAELADDLERLLQLQPVRARPASPWQRSVKMIRRNRGPLLAAALGAAVVLLLLAVVLLNERRAELRGQEFDAKVHEARLYLLAPERESWMFNQLARGRDAPVALHTALAPGLLNASDTYRQALELDPERTEIAWERAMVEIVLQRKPDLGSLRAEHDMLVEAVDRLHMFNNLSGLDPNELEAAPAETRRLIGLLAFLLGNVAICEQAWDGLDATEFPLLDAALGVVFLVDGRPERAYPRLDRACEAFPEAVFLRAKLADAAVSIDETPRAASLLAELGAATGLPTAMRADVARIRADLQLRRHNRDQDGAARREYERLAALQPDVPTPAFRLAQLDLRGGDAASSMRRLKTLVAQRPGVTRYRRALATAALQLEDVAVYLRQARYAVSADFGAGRSPGAIRDLLAILRDGGLHGLHRRGAERTGTARPIAEAGHAARFPVRRGPLSSASRVEAALRRVAAFDRDLATRFSIRLPDGPQRVTATALATAAGTALHYPELLGLLRPRTVPFAYGSALGLRNRWSDVTLHVVPTLCAALKRLGLTEHDARGLRREFRGSEHGDAFGAWAGLAAMPDVDGDGCAEVIVGAPQLPHDPVRPGYVRVYSGGDGRVLHELRGQAPGDGFGWSVAAAGDVDADGYPDIIVSARVRGYVALFSGRTGEELRRHPGPGGRFGWTVDGAGDIDRDGHADVLATELTENHWNGVVRVYSGKTGAELVTLHGALLEALGAGACGAGDIDADGFPDIAVSAPASAIKGMLSGRIEVISGRWIAERKGPQTIHTWYGDPGDRLGQRIASAGDVDGDGHPDVIAGANAANNSSGYARVYSGRTGEILWHWSGEPGDAFGLSVSGAGDTDGDGHDDLLVSAADKSAGVRGAVSLYSGKTGDLLKRWYGKDERDVLNSVSSGQGLILMGAPQCPGAPPWDPVGPGYVWVYSVPGSFVPLSEEHRPTSR